MATPSPLQTFLRAPSHPYGQPPIIKIKIIAIKDNPKVLSWKYTQTGCQPEIVKANVMCAVSDGISVSRFTLMEIEKDKVQEGETYKLKNIGTFEHGGHRILSVGKKTMFFKTSALEVPSDVEAKARQLLWPDSQTSHIRDISVDSGLVSITGVVKELGAINRTSGPEHFPMRKLTLEQDGARVPVCLWKLQALEEISLGQHIQLTHVKPSSGKQYGFSMSSTNFTTVTASVQEFDQVEEELEVDGIADLDKETVSLLTTSKEEVVLPKALFERHFNPPLVLPFRITAKKENGIVVDIKPVKEM